MECKFCKNIFSSKTNINHYIKTAKYCLKLQGIVQIDKNKCNGCQKSFSRPYELKRHKNICKSSDVLDTYIIQIRQNDETIKTQSTLLEYKDEKITELRKQLDEQKKSYESQISNLQDKLGEVDIKAVSRSTTTNNKTQINNYIQQLQPVTDEHLIDNAQHLTIDHIMKGPEGYAQYALEYPLKDRMLCVDYARRKVKFKDRDGNVITDPEMNNLATKFFNSIKDKNKELIVECGDKLKENFGDELETIVKIFDHKTGVERGCDGEKTEFHHDFVKQVCSRSIKE